MAINFAEAPEAMVRTLNATLPRLAASARIDTGAPAIARSAARYSGTGAAGEPDGDGPDGDGPLTTPVYVLGLDELAGGRGLAGARLTLWAQLLASEAGAASAEVQAGSWRFAQVTQGADVAGFRAELSGLARDAAVAGVDREVAQLRVPALHLTFVWLRSTDGGDDLFVPVGDPGQKLRAGQRYGAGELVRILQPAAEERLKTADLDG